MTKQQTTPDTINRHAEADRLPRDVKPSLLKLRLIIKAAREARGLSQRQLGALLGVSQSCVHAWESGSCNLVLRYGKKLAEWLNIENPSEWLEPRWHPRDLDSTQDLLAKHWGREVSKGEVVQTALAMLKAELETRYGKGGSRKLHAAEKTPDSEKDSL